MSILFYGPAPTNRPVIGWHSILRLEDISAHNAVVGRPASNLWNPDTASVWQADSLPTSIDMQNPRGLIVDYFAMAKHNLGSARVSYSLSISNDNLNYTPLTGLQTPADDSPIVLLFNPTNAPYIRLTMASSPIQTATPIVAHVRLGQTLYLPQTLYVGHAPATLYKQVERITQQSESGQYLGQIITRTSHHTSIKQENIHPDFIRQFITPFIAHCQGTRPDDGTPQGTFFFAWRPASYPSELLYGWTQSTIRPENQRPNGMMSFNFDMTGVA